MADSQMNALCCGAPTSMAERQYCPIRKRVLAGGNSLNQGNFATGKRSAEAADDPLFSSGLAKNTEVSTIPMPALGAAYEQALRLASSRGRPAPVRDDVMDAVTSCFIKGDADADGLLVRRVAQNALSGQNMGAVPSGIGGLSQFHCRTSTPRLLGEAPFPAGGISR